MKCLTSAALLIALLAVTHFASNFSFITILKFNVYMYVALITKGLLARKTIFLLSKSESVKYKRIIRFKYITGYNQRMYTDN